MSLPARQQRALNQIEKTLTEDPHLRPLFANFARLVGHEAMPATERVTPRAWRWRRMWPALVTAAGLAMVTGAFILSLTLPGPQACPGTVTAALAHVQSVPAVRQPACTTWQTGQEQLRGR
jgi:Protein of unknown function (DUF3040)